MEGSGGSRPSLRHLKTRKEKASHETEKGPWERPCTERQEEMRGLGRQNTGIHP